MGIQRTKIDRTPLLDNEDQNIGNSAIIQPQAGAVGSGTVIPQDLKHRLLNLTAGSASGQTTSVVMTARRIIAGSADNPYPGLPGPITGIVEFGNGGRFTRAEFDVPIGPFAGYFDRAASSLEPQDGGAIITVPTGVLRVYARYDNLLLTPLLNTNPPICLAQNAGVPVIGPGGPVTTVPPPPIVAEPLLVQAATSYFSRALSKVYKTLYCYVADYTAPVTIPLPLYTCFALPAFTRSVKVLRRPVTAQLDVYLRHGIQVMDQYRIATGAQGVAVEVVGHENIIEIDSVDLLADQVTFLAVVCEIGI